MPKQPKAKIQPPTTEDLDEVRELMAQATGATNPTLQDELYNQVLNTFWLPSGLSEDKKIAKYAAAIAMLKEIEPKDGLEGMLAAQMVGIHNAAMECLRRATHDQQSFQSLELYFKHAQKLMALFARQLETLNKHRGKGQQKVTVEHVNVAAGGQAIVGSVETSKTSEEAEPIPLEHKPAESMEILDVAGEQAEPVKTAKTGKTKR